MRLLELRLSEGAVTAKRGQSAMVVERETAGQRPCHNRAMRDFSRFDEPARAAVIAAGQWAIVQRAERVEPERLALGLTGSPPMGYEEGRNPGEVVRAPHSAELLAALDRARAAAGDGPVTASVLDQALSTRSRC